MPTRANTHIDKAISQLMLKRMINPSEDFIGKKILRPLIVDRDADKYYVYDNNHLRIDKSNRAAGAEANIVDFDFSTQSFQTNRYALKHFIDDDIYSNADDVIKRNLRSDGANLVTDKLLIQQEKRIADTVFNTANFSGKTAALSGTDQWSDYTNSDPFGDIETACKTVQLNCGKRPNFIAMGEEVWSILKNHPDVIDRLANDSIRRATVSAFTSMLSDENMKVSDVCIGGATYNTAAEDATDSFSFIWGKFFLVAYIDTGSTTLMNQTLGKLFIPQGFDGMSIKYYRLDQYLGEFVECNCKDDPEIISNDCGYLYSTVVA